MSRVYASLLLLLTAVFAWAQGPAVSWSVSVEPADVRPGETAMVVVTAKVPEGSHIFALQQSDAVTSTDFKLSGKGVTVDGDLLMPLPVIQKDEKAGEEVGIFSGAVAFGIPIRVDAKATGTLDLMVEARYETVTGAARSGPQTQALTTSLTLATGAVRADRKEAPLDPPVQPEGYIDPDKVTQVLTPKEKAEAEKKQKQEGTSVAGAAAKDLEDYQKMPLIQFLAIAFAAGLGALLTPCVFPMIPVTVSYFTKRSQNNPEQRVTGPLAYALGMIATFVGVGLVVAVAFGATNLIAFAQHPITNIVLGILFVVLALNLFGLFEIQLPSGLVNKANQGRTKGGLVGPFMMGLAFSLTSFTCTIGFVASLLALASQGNLFFPILGMLAFSLAFSTPFFLLALFPNVLSKMPRSGAWMQTTKIFMGFLELAAALKFFQNADIVQRWGLLTREVFLATWGAIFICAGLFMLGWMILPKEAGNPIGPARRTIGVGALALGVWFLVATRGDSLGELNSFLPPEPYPFKDRPQSTAKSPNNDELVWLEDWDEAITQARKENRNLIVDFTGYT